MHCQKFNQLSDRRKLPIRENTLLLLMIELSPETPQKPSLRPLYQSSLRISAILRFSQLSCSLLVNFRGFLDQMGNVIIGVALPWDLFFL